MEPVVNVVLPVFSIMLCGFVAGRTGLLGEGAGQALNSFVYYFSLPALFFGALASRPLDGIFNIEFILSFLVSVAICFFVSIVLAKAFWPNSLGGLTLNAMCATFSNTGYMGIPLLLIAYGEPGLLPAMIGTLLTGVVIMTVVIAALELDGSNQAGPGNPLMKMTGGILRSPLVMSAAAGLAWSGFRLPVPAYLASFVSLLADTAGPCALFAMGLFLVGKSIRTDLSEVITVSLIKLLLMPVISYYLAFHYFGMKDMWAQSVVILAALPTGALAFVMAGRYGLYTRRASSIILLNTVLSIVSLSVLFAWFDIDG